MSRRHQEPGLEGVLNRLIPNWKRECLGASDREIDELARIAERQLPPFYYWFLAHMGGSMGSLAYPDTEFTAASVIECYRIGVVDPDPRFFLIGVYSDDEEDEYLFLDLERPAREDAYVISRSSFDEAGDPCDDRFETFREMLGWGFMTCWGARECPQHCAGLLNALDGQVQEKLEPLLQQLGFTSSVATGPRCGLYEGEGTILTMLGSEAIQRFNFGAGNASYARSVLGKIALETSMSVESLTWNPLLPPVSDVSD